MDHVIKALRTFVWHHYQKISEHKPSGIIFFSVKIKNCYNFIHRHLLPVADYNSVRNFTLFLQYKVVSLKGFVQFSLFYQGKYKYHSYNFVRLSNHNQNRYS
ncbi:unnamed protein product [Heterobilharzia americana]|nr:unnamed protein product [Heterobilharzia americana]